MERLYIMKLGSPCATIQHEPEGRGENKSRPAVRVPLLQTISCTRRTVQTCTARLTARVDDRDPSGKWLPRAAAIDC